MIVVDASVLVKIATGEIGGDRALARVAGEFDRCAPDWIRLELASALAKKVRLGEFPAAAARKAIGSAPTLLTEFHPALSLIDRAWELATSLQHAIYDCLYLALAELLDCRLLTADTKFVKSVAGSVFQHRVELLA